MFSKDILKTALKNLIDDLNKLLIFIFLVLVIVTIFIKTFILDLIKILIFVIILYRLFSKNKLARQKENSIYLKFIKTIFKPFENIKRNIEDKNHIYRRCFKCKTTLKLPLPPKKGILHAKCPKCKKRKTILTFRKEKIEVIKKRKNN